MTGNIVVSQTRRLTQSRSPPLYNLSPAYNCLQLYVRCRMQPSLSPLFVLFLWQTPSITWTRTAVVATRRGGDVCGKVIAKKHRRPDRLMSGGGEYWPPGADNSSACTCLPWEITPGAKLERNTLSLLVKRFVMRHSFFT